MLYGGAFEGVHVAVVVRAEHVCSSCRPDAQGGGEADHSAFGWGATLPESFWPGCPPAECTVVGFAATLRVGTAKGAYVLRTHDDGNMYAFKRAAVEQLLTAAQALPP